MARAWTLVVAAGMIGGVAGWWAARATEPRAPYSPSGAAPDPRAGSVSGGGTSLENLSGGEGGRRPADDLRARIAAVELKNRQLQRRIDELEELDEERATRLDAVSDCLDWLQELSPAAFGDMTAEELLGTRELNLSEMALSDEDLALLRDLPALRRLTLRECEVTDAGLVHLAEVPNLERLGLRSTMVTDEGMAVLATAPNLNWLDLNLTAVGDRGIGALRDLDLTFLRLNYTKLTDAGLVHLPTLRSLERLDLWATDVSDTGLQVLHEMPWLTHLELGAVEVSKEWVEEFQAAHPDCYVRSKWSR